MGCDIHSVAINADGRIIEGGKWADGKDAMAAIPYADLYTGDGECFGNRNYGVFGFLAGVRNYSDVAPIADQRGIPADLEGNPDGDEWLGDHSYSWLSVDELNAFDYDMSMEDKRVSRAEYRIDGSYAGSDGGCTASAGGGKITTYRDFLGVDFFHDLAELNRIGADRIAFGFYS